MFEFKGRLKTLSIILILIGVVSVAFSFLGGGAGHHDDGHHDDHHATEEHAGDHAEGHGDSHSEEADHHSDDSHLHASADYGDVSPYAEEEAYHGYHKGASKALPGDNHFYKTKKLGVEEELLHHQEANIPWSNLLVNTFFFLAIALGALFFMAVQYAAQVGWSAVLLRIMEAISSFLWIPVVIMFVIFFTGIYHIGGNHIWHWMAEGITEVGSDNYDKIIAGKAAYLNGNFFLLRAAVYVLGWLGAGWLIRRMALKMDSGSVDPNNQWRKLRNLSAGFLVFFAVTSSTSAWDWIMSIDTHWFSTLFGWYTFATMFVSALTAITLITVYLKKEGYLPDVNMSHIHDMGKFMFAFSVFWTYLWFSQFMLIWYSNIPEEVTYYMARFGEYKGVFFTMVALNFLFPILVLMSRDAKRNFGFLLVTGLVIIFGHWLDVFIMVMPGTVGSLWSIGLVQIGTLLGFAGLFMFVVFTALSKKPLMIKKHPMFVESTHHHI